jgi:gluconokinase
MIIILMGVSGSGKTTIGRLLARDLGWDFQDADDFHPPENIAKMSSGVPLTDEDRQPWLQSLHDLILDYIQQNRHAVIACSALKEIYRTGLQVNHIVQFVYLVGSFELIRERLTSRQRHFMTTDLLASQFAALEEPQDVLAIDISAKPEEIVKAIRAAFEL